MIDMASRAACIAAKLVDFLISVQFRGVFKCLLLFWLEMVVVDRISSAVFRGVSHEGRLIGREARDQEQEGNRDTRVRQVQAVSMT